MQQTNLGLGRLLEVMFHGRYGGGAPPETFRVALVTADPPPTANTLAFAELTEIAPGNGYGAGGQPRARDSGFEAVVVDQLNGWSYVQTTDVTWTADGGPIPPSGEGASYAVLTDDDPDPAQRAVLGFWSLGAPRAVANGQTLTLVDPEFRLQQP